MAGVLCFIVSGTGWLAAVRQEIKPQNAKIFKKMRLPFIEPHRRFPVVFSRPLSVMV
jgi:hypothetical protein